MGLYNDVIRHWRGVLLGVVALLIVATLAAAQDRTYPQPGWLHAADKALYSWAGATALQSVGVSPRVAVPVAVVGLWGAGILVNRRAGHTMTVVDKAHDLAAHSLVIVPLSLKRRPRLAAGTALGLVALIVATCGRANPRSC